LDHTILGDFAHPDVNFQKNERVERDHEEVRESEQDERKRKTPLKCRRNPVAEAHVLRKPKFIALPENGNRDEHRTGENDEIRKIKRHAGKARHAKTQVVDNRARQDSVPDVSENSGDVDNEAGF